jgi:uncharacterized protein (TIGR00725 family)
MQIAIAAHSGNPSSSAKMESLAFIKNINGKCKDPVLLLGGYWGLMKVVVDEALKNQNKFVLILPVENDNVEVPHGVIKVKTGMEYRARSVPLVRSADALVSLGGGVGTMIEIMMAYSMGKPVYVLTESGMSSDKLMLAFPEYIDYRENSRIFYSKSGKELADTLCKSEGKSEVTDFG